MANATPKEGGQEASQPVEEPRKPIYVTQPSLPPLDLFVESLRDIWEKRILTNNGEYHQRFERELCTYLGVPECNLFTNGTLALLVGLQALRVTGEVITTPFSFVATTHSLFWNGIQPVFCDIEEETLNIDPERVESQISNKTTALLPVHVYGNPCDTGALATIADRYGLKIIYDAAHAFGVATGQQSLLQQGDISILSFHATKVFNTFEGGAIVHRDPKLKQRIDYLKNFGFAGETSVIGVGINGKMNELQAAFGLLQLRIVDKEIRRRGEVAARYREHLGSVGGLRIVGPSPGARSNHGYFPILISPKTFSVSREVVYEALKRAGVFARRYFYPLISHFPAYRSLPSASKANLPVAEKVAREVLCLPIYADLRLPEVDRICELILKTRRC